MINYFHYDYPDPVDEHPFSINTEMAACPWNPEHRLVRVGLQGRHIDKKELPPASLVFLIDVSGSMMPQTRLPLIKSGLKLLVNELREEDRVAIVVYAGAAGLVLPSTSGARKQEIIAAIDAMSAGGSTAGGAGIELAYNVALENFRTDGNNRVILATDGDFNVGVSDTKQLVSLIEEKRKAGVYLTVLGVGSDNLRDGMMEQLADHGNGNYYYLDRLDEAQHVLVGQLAGTLFTIAKDVKIQVEFNPERVASYRLIGYENRVLATQDFADDRKDAGELGAGHSVTALYEIEPMRAAGIEQKGNGMDLSATGDTPMLLPPLTPGLKDDEMMAVRLRYKPPTDSVSRLIVRTVEDGSSAIESASEDFRFATAVAELGLLLRKSSHKGNATLDDVLKLAHGSVGADTDGRRADFITMAENYRGTTTSGD
jgi:Ca-activated chloride channel family protein